MHNSEWHWKNCLDWWGPATRTNGVLPQPHFTHSSSFKVGKERLQQSRYLRVSLKTHISVWIEWTQQRGSLLLKTTQPLHIKCWKATGATPSVEKQLLKSSILFLLCGCCRIHSHVLCESGFDSFLLHSFIADCHLDTSCWKIWHRVVRNWSALCSFYFSTLPSDWVKVVPNVWGSVWRWQRQTRWRTLSQTHTHMLKHSTWPHLHMYAAKSEFNHRAPVR